MGSSASSLISSQAQSSNRSPCARKTFSKSRMIVTFLLKEVAENDKILQEEVAKEVARRGHTFNDLEADENGELHAGDVNYYGVASQGHRYTNATSKGTAKKHLGNG